MELQESSIDLKDLNLPEVLQKLYSATRPLGMGFLHDKPVFSRDDAQAALDAGARNDGDGNPSVISLDYVAGRPIKITFIKKDDRWWIRHPRKYDRDAGLGACEKVINNMRESLE